MQGAITKVEMWANEWAFRLLITKTQIIHFSRQNRTNPLFLKLYGRHLEQVKTLRFLGVWFDEKLTWKAHLGKMKCKDNKILNTSYTVCQDKPGKQAGDY